MSKNMKIIVAVGGILIISLIMFIIFGSKKETFTVSFYTDGGTIIESQTVEEGERVSRPSNPAKDGYIFDNWYIGNDIYDFTLKVTKNITLSAKWIKDDLNEELDNEEVIAEKFIVTFDSNGGSDVESQTIEENGTVQKPKDPTRKNYQFISWQLNGKDYDFTEEVTSDITLIAKWKKITTTNNTINNNNNNNNNNDNNNNNNNNNNNDNNNNDNEEPKPFDPQQPSEPESPKSYTVKFDTDGGNTISNQIVEEGKTVTKPADPTKNNHTFDGWYYNNAKYDFNTKVTADITLVAKWKKNSVVTYKVEETDSFVGQVKIFIINDNDEKVDGLVDIEFIDGNIKRDVAISKNGLTINKDKYKSISNARVK